MLKRIIWLIPVISVLFLSACGEGDALETVQTQNKDFKVEELFTHDGCTVYRFHDVRAVYFTNCRGTASYKSVESCGKNCTTEVDVETHNAGALANGNSTFR